MAFYIAALGNPGKEYEGTRHNVGQIILEFFRKKHSLSDWEDGGKDKLDYSSGEIKKKKVFLAKSNEFMNVSGRVVGPFIKKGLPEKAIVFHDDLDLPIGKFKVSYNRGTAGHKGADSVVKNIKSKKLYRVRIGISPSTSSGKVKKVKGDEKVKNFVLGRLSQKEKDLLKKISSEIDGRVVEIVTRKVKPPTS